jgi:hypothetical protein
MDAKEVLQGNSDSYDSNCVCRLNKEAVNSKILQSLELELAEELAGIIRQHLGINRIQFKNKL